MSTHEVAERYIVQPLVAFAAGWSPASCKPHKLTSQDVDEDEIVAENDELMNAFVNVDDFLTELFAKMLTNFLQILRNFESSSREKNVEFVDIVKRFPTSISIFYFQ